jgi:hypothetical protein
MVIAALTLHSCNRTGARIPCYLQRGQVLRRSCKRSLEFRYSSTLVTLLAGSRRSETPRPAPEQGSLRTFDIRAGEDHLHGYTITHHHLMAPSDGLVQSIEIFRMRELPASVGVALG